jgi:hypothetical protein
MKGAKEEKGEERENVVGSGKAGGDRKEGRIL